MISKKKEAEFLFPANIYYFTLHYSLRPYKKNLGKKRP